MVDLSSLLWELAFVYGAAGAGLVVALLVRRWTRRGGRVPSAAEATWCAFLPALAALVVPAVSAVQPHFIAPLAGLHGVWHRWEEAVHATALAHGALHAGNLLFLLAAAVCVSRLCLLLARMCTFAASIRAVADLQGQEVEGTLFCSLPIARPACFTLGVLQPTIYLTTGLRERLSPRDCAAMLAHETAHIRRRDGLIGALLAVFYHLFPLPGSGRLQADWARAAERACDAEAARRIGSPADVAAALVRVARLVGRSAPVVPGVTRFAGSEDIPGRVEALLAMAGVGPATMGRHSTLPTLLIAVSLGLILAAGVPLHHLVELFVQH